jgi:hypothetical protein
MQIDRLYLDLRSNSIAHNAVQVSFEKSDRFLLRGLEESNVVKPWCSERDKAT